MSNTVSPSLAPATRTTPFALALAGAVVVPAVAAIALSAGIAAIARAAGASHSFKALTISAYAPFIVIGLIAGAVAWSIIRRRSADPARLLRRLVPAVVLVSLVPDILVGAGHSLPGASWGGVTALMIMHIVVAVCGVLAYRIFLPLDERS